MPTVERVTVTLPIDLVSDIDRRERNRSKFILDAVRHELDRRRRDELRRSLQNPHPESSDLADEGLEAWSRSLPEEACSGNQKKHTGRRWPLPARRREMPLAR